MNSSRTDTKNGNMTQDISNKMRPLALLTVTVVISLSIFYLLFSQIYEDHQRDLNDLKDKVSFERNQMEMAHLNEIMASSLEMAYLSGESQWIERYKNAVGRFNAVTDEIFNVVPDQGSQILIREAREQFLAYDNKALHLIENRKLEKAEDILESRSYKNQKRLFEEKVRDLSYSDEVNIRLVDLRGKILVLDEILTMSAKKTTVSTRPQWEEDYNLAATALDSAIAESLELSESQTIKNALSQTSGANDKLIELEGRAFTLSKQDKRNQARDLLNSSEYLTNKQIYSDGMARFSRSLDEQIDQISENAENLIRNEILLIGAACILLISSWIIVWWSILSWKTRLAENNQALERKMLELEGFTYRTSHDLKAPLINIRGLSDIIKEDLADSAYEEVSVNIQKVGDLTVRLESLVDDIVETARIDYVNDSPEEVNLVKELVSIKDNLSTLIDDKQVAVQADLDESKTVWVQRRPIQHILENLISNAIKYSDPEKTQRFVKLEVSNSNGNTLIRVSDNGLGIPKKYDGEIFGMFKRFHKSSTFGTGLGLYLVKKNVQKINGEISFQRSPDGSIFTIFLPASEG